MSIGLHARRQLLAVALDTNALGQGRPHLGKLRSLAARLKVIGLPVWVPEPVAWEWAQHIAEDWQALFGTAKASFRRLTDAGLDVTPPVSPYADHQAAQQAFLQALAEVDNVTVMPLSAENAMKGLKDQILQRSPGRRKDGVKTGGADSAWLRDLNDHATGDLSRVLLISSDADVTRACQDWRIPMPLMRSSGQVLETLFTFTLDDSDATVTRLIVGYLRDRLDQDPPGPCGFTVTADPRQLATLAEETLAHALGSTWNRQLVNVELTHLNQLIGLINVAVQTPDPGTAVTERKPPSQPVTHTALARVFFLGTVEFLYQKREHFEHGRTHTWREDDVLIYADLAFEIQDGGAVTGAESRREAGVTHPRWFGEPSDALQEVCEALSTVPLLGFPSSWPDADHVELRGPGDVLVYAELQRHTVWSGWRLTVAVGDPAEWVELTCEQDDEAIYDDSDPARTWPDLSSDPPWQLRVSDGSLPSGNPAWGLAGWVMSQLPI
ncbi:hypothetical protein ABZ897_43180 [Nonomuraea sp. NPDC046802]|uniref:hypothetical protein n=1 Tax=Nonomuraea sp. NPDC046802 TaxID=3154919 RepID=UPI0033D9E12D